MSWNSHIYREIREFNTIKDEFIEYTRIVDYNWQNIKCLNIMILNYNFMKMWKKIDDSIYLAK